MKELSPLTVSDSPFLQNAPVLSIGDEDGQLVRAARIRIFISMIIFAGFALVLITRLANISLFNQKNLAIMPAAENIKLRGNIYDRNGELLVSSLKTFSLYADPRKVWDIENSTEAILSVLPDLDPVVLEEKLRSKKAFVWIRRNLTPKEKQAVFELGLPELGFKTEPKRVYPRGSLAAHVLGFTDIDQNGVAGVERAFGSVLQTGQPAVLSIDLRVQFALEDELKRGMSTYQALAASGIVMNIKTGELLALASMPDFNPNRPAKSSPENRLNHASMSLYELGSTFKPISMALALEEGVVSAGEKIPVQNKLKIRDKIIRDDHKSKVPLGAFDILAKSSNKGVSILSLRAGAQAQQNLLRKLGLFDRVPIELKESARPLIAKEWQDLTVATVSYGHGISVTPLALATAISALLNDGVYIEPTIYKRQDMSKAGFRRVVSSQTSRTLTDMMRYVVTNGTGRNAEVAGYGVMGKTGTAEKLIDGKYVKNRLLTSFVAAFPHKDPKYLVFIVYDEPKPTKDSFGYATAGWNATKTAGAVIERIVPILGVRPDYNEQIALLGGGQ